MSVTITITVKEGVIHWIPKTGTWALVTGYTKGGKPITKPIPERLRNQLAKYEREMAGE
jgi:hypothetical protein